jgi:hypothetical protein
MNSLLARNFSKGGHSIIRSFSGGPIPTTSTVQSGTYKVVGLDHLSVSGVAFSPVLFDDYQLIASPLMFIL